MGPTEYLYGLPEPVQAELVRIARPSGGRPHTGAVWAGPLRPASGGTWWKADLRLLPYTAVPGAFSHVRMRDELPHW